MTASLSVVGFRVGICALSRAMARFATLFSCEAASKIPYTCWNDKSKVATGVSSSFDNGNPMMALCRNWISWASISKNIIYNIYFKQYSNIIYFLRFCNKYYVLSKERYCTTVLTKVSAVLSELSTVIKMSPSKVYHTVTTPAAAFLSPVSFSPYSARPTAPTFLLPLLLCCEQQYDHTFREETRTFVFWPLWSDKWKLDLADV